MNILNEIWKDIPEFEGFYQVSNYGRVRSCDRCITRPSGVVFQKGKILSPSTNKAGYFGLVLCKDGRKPRMIHSLVASAFLGERPDDYCINHKDGNKLNNAVTNLEYCTQKENIHHANRTGLSKVARGEKSGSAKLTNIAVANIRKRIALGHKVSKIAKDYGVDYKTIYAVKIGQSWKHI
jgi:hypothetical protein